MAEPVDDNQGRVIEEAAREFVEARWRGEEPDIDEFVKRYPHIEHQLRQRIQDVREIDVLFDSLVQADDSDFEDITDEQDLVGKKISNFEIVEIIGRGGMGVVYLAHDTKLKRSVAIKSLPAGLQTGSNARKRFRREAELLASLNHPNIAVIHEIIEEDRSGYLILEYVPGETLSERIIRKPLTLEETLSIGRQVAEAISAAHEKGVVHRDLKPGNIKITPDGRVKVLDFGLAKVPAGENKSGEITETQPGRGIGTPAYMSPEQARGKDIDHRTDIWSFGCILYQMLTGRLPFEGQTATDTLARIIERQPDWEMLPQYTPANIRTLLQRCLEKEPDLRLSDIADAIIEIKEALNKPAAVSNSKLRKTTMAISTVIIIVLAAIAVRFTLKQQIPATPGEIWLVVLPFRYHGPAEQEWLADSMTDEITTRLACIHGLRVKSYQTAIQYKNKEISAQQIGKKLTVDYILEGSIQPKRPLDPNSPIKIRIQLINSDDDTHVWAQPYEYDFDDIFVLQSKIAEQVSQALDITLLKSEQQELAFRPTENNKAYEFYCSGKDYYNRRDFRQAIELLEQAVKLDPEFALAYAQLSRAHISLYWGNKANQTRERLSKAEEAVFKAQALDPDLPEVHLALGHYYYHGLRKYDQALKEFAIVLRVQPNNDEALAFTCYVQRKQGKVEEALANIIKASDIHPVYQTWAMDIPELLIYLKRFSEAAEACDRAIRLYPGYDHPWRVKAWVCLYRDGTTDEARKVLQEASKIIESPEIEYVNILAILDVFDRKYDKALERLSLPQDIKGPFLPRLIILPVKHFFESH